MVIRPQTAAARGKEVVPVWQAIEARQRQAADAYYLVAQPDHAHLSGDLAQHFEQTPFPVLAEDVVCAIGLHDAGWGLFVPERDPASAPIMNAGRPRSFIEFTPADFTRAWKASIERAATVSPLAAGVVSRHFTCIGELSLKSARHDPENERILRLFLEQEYERQHQLGQAERTSELLKVLQFCDLLSLYLCCGAEQPARFPQQFGGSTVSIRRDGDACWLEPSPFKHVLRLAVPMRSFPQRSAAATLPVVIG